MSRLSVVCTSPAIGYKPLGPSENDTISLHGILSVLIGLRTTTPAMVAIAHVRPRRAATIKSRCREYPACGLSYLDFADAVRSLAEACTVIRRLWSEAEPFDLDGTYNQLTGAFCDLKPVQQPYSPFMIGGRTTATLSAPRRKYRCGQAASGTGDLSGGWLRRSSSAASLARVKFHTNGSAIWL